MQDNDKYTHIHMYVSMSTYNNSFYIYTLYSVCMYNAIYAILYLGQFKQRDRPNDGIHAILKNDFRLDVRRVDCGRL